MYRRSPLTPITATAIAILMLLVLLPTGALGISTAATVKAANPYSGPLAANDRYVLGPAVSPTSLSSPARTASPTTDDEPALQAAAPSPSSPLGCQAVASEDATGQSMGCVAAPHGTFDPASVSSSSTPASVTGAAGVAGGASNGDYSAAAPAGTIIGSVTGTFPSTYDLTSEVSGAGSGCSGGTGESNCYGLQINSQLYAPVNTPYTGDSSYQSTWEQFVYENDPAGHFAGVYIQYVLVNYISSAGFPTSNSACPSTYNGISWSAPASQPTICYAASATQSVPSTFLSAPLTSLVFEAFADYKGSTNDVLQICGTPSSGLGCSTPLVATDGVLDLGQYWNYAEFNVIGDLNGAEAIFNTGATITVSNNLTDQSGNAIAPSCIKYSETAEYNSLFLGPCSTTSSGIFFTEASLAYTVSVSPSDVTVLRGQTATYTVAVTLTQGTTEPVTLSVVSGLPSGATWSFTPNPVSPTATSTLSIFTSLSGGLGDYTFTVQGKYGGLIDTGTAKLHAYDFTVGLAPSDYTVLRGTSTFYSVTLKLLSGSSTTNVPSEGLSVSGLPGDATHSFSPTSLVPTLAGSPPSTLTVTTHGPPTGSLGDYTFTVTATDPNPSGGSRSGSAHLHIFDFTVGVTPISQTTLRGTSTVYALKLTLVAGSSTTGVPAMGITVSGLPVDSTYVLSASSITPTLTGSATQTLTVTTHGPPTGSLGDFPFTVTATDPNPSGGSRIGSPSLHIFDFTVTLAPSAESLVQGGSVTMTVSLALVPGSTTVALPNIAMSLTGLPSGVISVGFPSLMSIGSTATFILETSTVASYVSCPQVSDLGGQLLPNADLAHCNLAGYDLQGASLEHANLFGANLQGADLAGADLLGANLASANTADANFQGANLLGVDLSSAFPLGPFALTAIGMVDGGSRTSGISILTVLGDQLSGDDFQGADLWNANLTSDVAVGTNFEGARLQGADLRDVNLREADFQDANLEQADLAGTALTGVPSQLTNFNGADLRNTNFTGALCGSPNFITASGANKLDEVGVPAACNPPLGYALSGGLSSGSSSSAGLPSWAVAIIGIAMVGAVLGVVIGTMRRRRPPSAAGSHSPPALSSSPGERRTERRPGYSRPPLKTTRAAKNADDVIRKARAAQSALAARGQFDSARKLGEAADLLAGLAELPEERDEPDTMHR